MVELRNDPTLAFDFEVDLTSRNQFIGTLGPLVNGKLCMTGTFREAPTDADIAEAKSIANSMVGRLPAHVMTTHTAADYRKGQAIVREFLGGGRG